MKIAIFSDTFPPQINGVANVVYKSAISLTKMGHQVEVFTISNGKDDKANDITSFKHDGIELIRFPSMPAPVYPGYRLAIPVGIAIEKLRRFRPDVIHTHTPFSIGWSLIGPAKLMHIPIIGTHHTFYDHYLKHAHLDYDWAKRLTWSFTLDYYNRCDLVLSPSQSLADQLQSHGLKKPFELLSNSVDTDLFCPAVDKKAKELLKKSYGITGNSLVYMGRLSYEKSVDQVLKAIAEVVKIIPDIKLMIIGDGPERENLNKLAQKLKIKENVLFVGFKQNQELVEALQANDIFVTASKTENMPLSVIEAMAIGLPVVAADALGMPEIAEDGVNGYIFAPDDWKEMSEKILAILENENLLDKFSAASREASLLHSEDCLTKKLESIYKKLIMKSTKKTFLSKLSDKLKKL